MDDEKLIEAMARAICAENCAFYGEPPCFLIEDEHGGLALEWPAPGCDEPSCTDLARAALAAVRRAEGWRLVPVEPTDDMIDAFREELIVVAETGIDIGTGEEHLCWDLTRVEDGYRAMLAAAVPTDD